MSFDLAAWHSERALDASTADAVYQAICAGSPMPMDDVVTPSPRVSRFLAALGARYPDLDALPEEQVDDSPWSSGFEYTDAHAIFNIRWPRAEQMLAEMRELATAHGLVLYDPQDGTVYD